MSQKNESRDLSHDMYMQADIEAEQMDKLREVCDVAQISIGQGVRYAIDYIVHSAMGPHIHFDDGAPIKKKSIKYYTTRESNERLKILGLRYGISKVAVLRAAIKHFNSDWVNVMNSVTIQRKRKAM